MSLSEATNRTVAHQTVDQNGVTHAADVLRAEHAESFGLQHAVQTVIAEFILIAVHIDVVDRTDHAAVGQCPERQFDPVALPLRYGEASSAIACPAARSGR